MSDSATDCNETRNGRPDPVRRGPTTPEGRVRALANLRRGAIEHGGWRFLRRAELPMPWGPAVQLEIDEMKAWLLSKCGGPDAARLSALMRIRRVGQSWGFLACLEHWTANRHGDVQTLAESWQTKPGKGLMHIKHGRLPKALSDDYARFYERMVQDLEALEREHFIDHNTVPTPGEYLAALGEGGGA